ncbi:MAG: ATP-binding protein [Thermodesulfobacteriota bacterium]
MSRFRQLSIRRLLLLVNGIVLCLLFPALGALQFRTAAQFRDSQLAGTLDALRRQMEDRVDSLAQSTALSAGQAISGFDYTFLQQLLSQMVEADEELVSAVLVKLDGTVLAAHEAALVGAVMASAFDGAILARCRREFPDWEPEGAGLFHPLVVEPPAAAGAPLLEVLAPVYVGRRLVGVVRCGFALDRLARELDRTRRLWAAKTALYQGVFLGTTGVFFVLGCVVALFFGRSLSRSVGTLVAGVRQLTAGGLDVSIRQQGLLISREVAELTEAFNEMAARLRRSYQRLEEYSRDLEALVAERTRELKEAQANLLQQAHEAGMAEMAVGILHNIGNAITPAMVSTTMLSKRLAASPLRTSLADALVRAAELVAAPAASSPAERERLAAILRLVPGGIREEYDAALAELGRVGDKHRHIEEIIRLQLRYARVQGFADRLDLNLLAEDALAMMAESLGKRQVRVVRHFQPVPQVQIEQGKLMQILINLIKNAYEAMEETALPDRQLTVATWLEPAADGQGAKVALAVRDTGVGFSAAEEEQLFRFGYTTKARGSGFGLHSCAVYLAANHGSITAQSPGPGQGAEIIIRLPPAGAGEGTAGHEDVNP